MWLKVVCLFMVLATCQGWEYGKKYEYLLESKILRDDTNEMKETKILATALFQFKWDSEHLLTGRFRPIYVGDKIEIIDSLAVPKDAFQVVFKAGQVMELRVSQETSPWQVEFIRGMVGFFQISDSTKEKDQFTIMEESVAGRCKTFYKVHRQPDGPGVAFEKTRNYTDCERTPVFERGVYGTNNYDALMKSRDIMARDSRIMLMLKNGHEILEAEIREDIQMISEGKKIMFETTTSLFTDASEIERIRETSDYDDFDTRNLISVGSLMYRPKPQKPYCHKQMGLQRNEIESSCEVDYYMNPKHFNTSYKGKEVNITKMLAEQISEELKTPSEMTIRNTLDRFTVLVGIIRSMDSRQIEEVYGFWDPNSKQSFVFLSAILQTGTLESLKALRYLKQNNKIRSDVMGFQVIPGRVHPLTLEYLDTLFEFATDPELVEKDFIFSKNLFIPFSSLLRRYSTEKEKAFKQEQLDKLILKKYRKYLSEKLQDAVLNVKKENLRLQTYIRALGNMADLSLFNQFWATSANKLTPFHKTLLVNSMDYAVEMHPEKSRIFLMKIYNSSEEKYSVRTAAAYQLFKTNLPEDKVSDMIQIAKDSGNGHIQSAVKSAVLAEGYEYHKNEKINEMAQSIEITQEEIATTNNKFSELRFQNYSDNVQKTLNFVEVILGMDENPSSIFAYQHFDKKGFKSDVKFGGMMDYVRSFLRGLTSPPGLYDTVRTQASMGNLELDKDFEQLFVPFENVITSPKDLASLFDKDNQISYKLLQIYDEVAIGFPTESGFPFLYTYQVPILRDFEIATHVGDNFKADINLHFPTREQTKMGFVNPITGKHYVYGIDVNKQASIPISITYQAYESTRIITIDPLFREERQRLLHFATWPYTGIRDLPPVKPVAEDEGIENIENTPALFRGELPADDTNRLRFKVVSTELGTSMTTNSDSRPPTRKVNEFIDSSEMQAYYYPAGPFGDVKPTHNMLNLFFQDDPNHPTSAILKLDFSPQKSIVEQQMENVGKIRGPFLFMGKSVFQGDFEITGPKNHSVSMEVTHQSDLIGSALKVGLEGSYSENGQKSYEACFDAYMKQRPRSLQQVILNIKSDDENMIDVFTRLRFGQTCKNGSFVSAEAEVDTNSLENTSDLNLNVTVDFDGLPDEVAKELCAFEGDSYPGKETMSLNLKIIQKNPEKCEGFTKVIESTTTGETETLSNAEAETVSITEAKILNNTEADILSNPDVEIVDVTATE